MKKLDKDLYIQHAKRMKVILDEKSTFIPFLTRPDFKEVIKTELNVLGACEKLFAKTDIPSKSSAKHLTTVFNKLTKENFAIDSKFKYEDETDLIDHINYLVTFCNNMFKVNLNDLVEGKKVTATDPHIDLRAKPDYDTQTPRMSPNFAFAAGIPTSATPYENPYLLGRAYAKLNDDINHGSFYRFKTQPKIIPIAKKISFALTILTILALITCSILGFVSTGLKIQDGESTSKINYIMNGIFYIIAAGFGIYPLFITISGWKNPNKKFYFNWGFMLMFIILATLFTMMDVISIWLNWDEFLNDPENKYQAFKILKYLLLVTTCLGGVGLIPVIIGAVCNPKPDAEAIDRKIKEYVDLFSSEIGQAPVPPKADVQTPTEVKESKPSKDKSKK